MLVKVALGLLLTFASIFCLQRFRAGYVSTEVSRAGLQEVESTPSAAINDPALALAETTNLVSGAVSPSTTTDVSAGVSAATNVMATVAPGASPATGKPTNPPGAKSNAFGWLGGFVASTLVLAGFLAWEVAQWFSRRTGSIVFSEDAPAETDPEYDSAEAEWAKGNHLEAIALMREYLKSNPREQYVAIRIAEIYEKDLGNAVAATLELEEVLTQSLSREKWGWTAIHLANLYSGSMNQPAKAMALLERIIAEYPETGAAKKARVRLGVSEGTAAPEEPSQDPENPNLPRGFSAKKK